MFTITIKEYNSTTGEYDKSITDTIRLHRLLTYTDGTTHKPGYAEAPNGVYSGPDTQATAWLNLKNIRFYLIENDTTKCFVDIPVIGYDEEWVGDSGLTESDVTKIIGTTITKDYVESLKVRATDIIGDTITGKTIKSSGDKWYIGKDGDGKLANGNIKWDASGGVTFGDKVSLKWSNVTDKPSDLGGLTENDVTDIIGTTITKDYIESKKIRAAEIEAGALTAHEATIKNLAASQITADKINALDITAKDISATTLTGKTIKSTDGNWEINNAGTFKLGGSNGINKSSATGGIQFGTTTNGFNLDANGKLTFGSNVKLSWGNVSDRPTIPTESSITTITNNAISTANLDAGKITTGTLSTDRLDVNNLTVKKLNTTGSNTGARIAVEGNNINIYNTSNRVTCTITNSSMGNLDIYDVLQGGTGGTIDYSVSPSVNMYVPTSGYSGQQTINWSCGGKQALGYFQAGATIKIGGKWNITGMSHPAGSITLQPKLTIKIYGNDAVQKTLEGNSGTSGISATTSSNFSSIINETTFTVPFAGTWAYEATITGWWTPSNLTASGNVSFDSSLVSITGSYSSYDSTVKTSSRIFDDGAIFQNKKGGFAINDNAVAMKCGSSQIVMKDGNVYMAFAGSATPKQIVPRTFKFRLDGNKNQTMTVLTFGDILEE
jgi:hypothetical protein